MMTGWFFIGLVIGAFITLSQILTVHWITPEKTGKAVIVTILGAGSRWLLAAVLLLLALWIDISSGLLAFAGLWLARWVTLSLYGRFSEPVLEIRA